SPPPSHGGGTTARECPAGLQRRTPCPRGAERFPPRYQRGRTAPHHSPGATGIKCAERRRSPTSRSKVPHWPCSPAPRSRAASALHPSWLFTSYGVARHLVHDLHVNRQVAPRRSVIPDRSQRLSQPTVFLLPLTEEGEKPRHVFAGVGDETGILLPAPVCHIGHARRLEQGNRHHLLSLFLAIPPRVRFLRSGRHEEHVHAHVVVGVVSVPRPRRRPARPLLDLTEPLL